jgi:mannose-1-phosphate guanylyltransferase
MIIPVVMAGGTGSRLWPLSRELHPKQFLRISGDVSMIQDTLLRLSGLDIEQPLVICNEDHRFLVAEQLRQIDMLSNNIILEPVGRNTAPAIALAAFNATMNNDDPLLLVLAADHVIKFKDDFHNSILQAIPFADKGKLVTFGIIPTSPETGYGYIHRGGFANSDTEIGFNVESFVEKPVLQKAKKYLESGEYYWNSGMFLFRAKRYLQELEAFRPDIYQNCKKAILECYSDNEQNFIRINEKTFSMCSDESIDYAVMEKTKDAVVIPMDAGWNDVGSWSALWEVNAKDSNENVISGDVFTHEIEGCYINADDCLVAAIGVNNLVIVSTKDAVLVINKDKVQDVKKVVEYLKKNGRTEHREHRETYKPWGHSDKIVNAPRYNINRVTVKPGEKISEQMHHHRAEHWVVLSGTARVELDNRKFLLTENQSTFIPIGAMHSLENPGKINLEILEIQSGSYLNDDDIVRMKESFSIED